MEYHNMDMPRQTARHLNKKQKLSTSDQNPEMEFLFNHFNMAKKTLAKSYIIMNCSKTSMPLKQLMNNLEKLIIDSALHVSCGSQKKAAVILGVKQTSLCEKIKKLKIEKNKSGSRRFLIPEINKF